jgi:hypothetical protein
MVDNKIVKRRGITLKTPGDARRIIRRVVDRAFEENQVLEYSGRISQLLSCWLKAYEMDKLSEIESRLTALEQQAKENKR